MDALMFYEPTQRILISGDALWENGMGFVWPEEGPNPFIDAALATLDTIEKLEPAIVIPGHGKPFANVAGSVANVRERLDAFAREPAKNARHVVKVMFVFALLDRGRMAVADVPAYLGRIACYRRMSERFLGRAPESLAQWLVEDLARSGVIRVSGEVLTPTLAA
jgi:glyoxylase-like metal-dependent hydrolase (beta-lactamase superfamily II)